MAHRTKNASKALIAAFKLAVEVRSVPSDALFLILDAYERQNGNKLPGYERLACFSRKERGDDLDKLIAALAIIPPLNPEAQALLDGARCLISEATTPWTAVELPEDDTTSPLLGLAPALLWALLMAGGANPDLALTDERAADDNICYTQRSKFPWFLCRVFLQSHRLAKKDGEYYAHRDGQGRCLFHRLYVGRLFLLDTTEHTCFTRARVPRATRVLCDGSTCLIQTDKGLWGFGDSSNGQLGLTVSDFVDPTRLTFPACPEVAALEASLPLWEKHRLVRQLSVAHRRVLLLTPVGLIIAGDGAGWATGGSESGQFQPVPLPDGFVPDHIINDALTVILSMGDHQLIAGDNYMGRLGIGHTHCSLTFVDLPVHVDRIVVCGDIFTVYSCGSALLFAGQVSSGLVEAGIMPGHAVFDRCVFPVELTVPRDITRFWCDHTAVCCVAGATTLFISGCCYHLPIEAAFISAVLDCSPGPLPSFMDVDGDVYVVSKVKKGTCHVTTSPLLRLVAAEEIRVCHIK
ncbi:endodeoxyribonuclease RusA family protein [Carpediemonas membranifera]|uniref:Endodeoxyribonuclease RusA family protein n=1 Tax=Carpediemonas membranifera TaxID=201153 RepID=A0A8J6ASQ6_9EUKA|nr:endodeoxyribonuclease RusA family protein [Carpediemonas membranifera]|eukprot:KAG9393541.1 endodeoxyribonuclease RusA family protein [Carpediemonas membranifera]